MDQVEPSNEFDVVLTDDEISTISEKHRFGYAFLSRAFAREIEQLILSKLVSEN